MSVSAVGVFFDDAIGAAFASVVAATVVDVGGSANVGAVVDTSTEPRRSGTSVCEGPDAGGGTGAVLFGRVVEVVVVDERVVDVRVVVVVVDAGDAIVVVVVGSSGGAVVGTVCAMAPAAPASRHKTSAPKQTQRFQRTAAS
jgi:hypothetical protein